MLTRLEITDFALIEKAVLLPAEGLCIITGETGAGKSILIDAIGALTGTRINKDLVRFGQNKAVVEAVFSPIRAFLTQDLLTELDLDRSEEDDEIILAREILSQGKSICRINGRMVAQSMLRQTAACLIDIHGQNDQQQIFQIDTHRLLLDRFAGQSVQPLLLAWYNLLQEWQSSATAIQDLGSDPAERARQLDLLHYQVDEIEQAGVRIDEEEKLQQRKKVLTALERIREGLSASCDLLDQEEGHSVASLLGQTISALDFSSRHSQEIAQQRQQLDLLLEQILTIRAGLQDLLEHAQARPGEMEQIDERLDLFYRLKKKYGGNLSAIQAYLDKARARLDQLTEGETLFERLQAAQDQLRQRLLSLGDQLHQTRQAAATRLEKQIADELTDLGMKGVRFAVEISRLDVAEGSPWPHEGLDRISFQISANPGEPMKPLARIASGGEASRVLLAIKKILAHADHIPVLIFDEIDTGVSGQTASQVADKLKQISESHQVFCITHMAQIAARADQHLLIEKHTDGQKTHTELTWLDLEGRRQELARLLAGPTGGETARRLADQLLAQSDRTDRMV